MSKDLFIKEHDRLAAEYMEEHPLATETEAYDRTADLAYAAMQGRYADMIDDARQRAKDKF